VPPPTDLVALKSQRERAISLIGDRYAEGVIDEEELDERLELAERATDLESLAALTADLAPPADTGNDTAAIAVNEAPPPGALVRASEVPASRRIVTLLSSGEYRGSWVPARETTVFNVLGSTTVDLREALLSSGEIALRVRVVLGDVIVIIPRHVRVTVEAIPILGDIKRDQTPTTTDLSSPHVRISGFVCLGDIKIRVQRPGESWRETKKRRKIAAREAKRQRKLKAARGS